MDVITKVSDRIPDIAKQFGIEPVEKARGKRRPKPQKGGKTAEGGPKDEAATSSDDSGADERTNSSTEEQVSTSTEEALSSSDADVAEVHDAETPEAEADQGADAPPEEPPSENVTKEVD